MNILKPIKVLRSIGILIPLALDNAIDSINPTLFRWSVDPGNLSQLFVAVTTHNNCKNKDIEVQIIGMQLIQISGGRIGQWELTGKLIHNPLAHTGREIPSWKVTTGPFPKGYPKRKLDIQHWGESVLASRSVINGLQCPPKTNFSWDAPTPCTFLVQALTLPQHAPAIC